MSNTILRIVTHSVQLATVIVCIYYLTRKQTVTAYRWLAAGWAIVLLFDLTMVTIGLFNPVKNHWVYNIGFPLIQLFCIWIIIILLASNKYLFTLFLFAAFAAYNLFFLQGATVLNTHSIALGGVITLALASVKLVHLWREDTPRSLFAEPDFWVCAGFILYWGTATPFYAMYNYLWQASQSFFMVYFFTVNFGFTVILNICIIKSLQCSLHTAKR